MQSTSKTNAAPDRRTRLLGGRTVTSMVVTIDGPAGAGKSSVARRLAERLGFLFLDTGAMYRAIAWFALQSSVDLDDFEAVEQLAFATDVHLTNDRVFVNEQDVSSEIRSSQVTKLVGRVANHGGVRRRMTDLQRAYAAQGDVVTEGRDQGTTVFPDADCKIFLTASAEERARRRYLDLVEQGESISLEEVLDSQNTRDANDASRQISPMAKAHDAVEVNSEGLSQDEVLDRLESIVRTQLGT